MELSITTTAIVWVCSGWVGIYWLPSLPVRTLRFLARVGFLRNSGSKLWPYSSYTLCSPHRLNALLWRIPSGSYPPGYENRTKWYNLGGLGTVKRKQRVSG